MSHVSSRPDGHKVLVTPVPEEFKVREPTLELSLIKRRLAWTVEEYTWNVSYIQYSNGKEFVQVPGRTLRKRKTAVLVDCMHHGDCISLVLDKMYRKQPVRWTLPMSPCGALTVDWSGFLIIHYPPRRSMALSYFFWPPI